MYKNIVRCCGIGIVLSFCSVITLSAQNGVWTWVNGSNSINPPPNFGIQGVTSPANQPHSSYSAASWTDLNGNFWFLGGIDDVSITNIWGALWKYEPATGLWTWMKGPNTPNNAGVYGTLGVPSPLNNPGARAYGSCTWTDNAGNLWLFGGFAFDSQSAFGEINDFWMYDISTNEWTWMGGSNIAGDPGNFGTLQVPAPTNMPSSRSETIATWNDAQGNFWMFGGTSYDDVWKYDVSANIWTWMAGSNSIGAGPVFGTQGVSSPANTPDQRWIYAHWKDLQGNFWIYGGYLQAAFVSGDMWKFDPVTLEWTWMAGSSLPNDLATFNQQCVPGNRPDGTYEGRSFWTDDCGRFWYAHGASINNFHNYVWMFDPVTNQFTWISGTTNASTPPSFGTLNVPAASNYPPVLLGAAPFKDLQGNLYLFGGYNPFANGIYNAVWRYQIDPLCPGTTVNAAFSTSAQNFSGCAPFSVQFNPFTTNYTSYAWDFGDTTTLADTSNLSSPGFTYTTPGTYTVTLIVSGNATCGSGTDTSTAIITVYPQPVVNLGSDSTICNGLINLTPDAGNAGSTYLWSTGATTQTINITAPGIYSVTVSSGPNGLCSDQDTLVITQPAQPDLGGDTVICAGQSLLLDPGITGTQYIWSNGATTPTINVSSTGLYSVQIINPPCTLSTAMNLTVTPLPVVNLGNDTTLCPDESIVLNAQNPGAIHVWNTGANTQTITTSSAGSYAVTVTAQNCSSSDTIAVATTQNLSLDETVSLCGSFNALTLDAGNPGASYLWSTGDNTQTISIQQPGTYWVNVSAPPCVLTDTIEVTGNIGEAAVYIPNSFTPNGDGLNDRFTGYGENFSSFRLLIFNRWGELIFETTDPNGWDGFYAGQRAKGDVYVYKLTYTSSCTGGKFVDRLGHVLLIR
ncbi:MAG: gliding motility-associated C-terminal domain-containing protein [Bacteroidia bacterium]|jgi:gliding motility-associated-like protein|nr:gliding motility-associated C-terminal domain-containing protein [Bacteroidia bacterium]